MKTRLILVAMALAPAAFANPYDSIAPRNVFSLAPPKVDVSKPGDVFKPPPEYKLTGIAGFGAAKWALLSKADPFTETTVSKDNRTLYRARFAGLDRDSAEAVCRTLKRADISCMTVRN